MYNVLLYTVHCTVLLSFIYVWTIEHNGNRSIILTNGHDKFIILMQFLFKKSKDSLLMNDSPIVVTTVKEKKSEL